MKPKHSRVYGSEIRSEIRSEIPEFQVQACTPTLQNCTNKYNTTNVLQAPPSPCFAVTRILLTLYRRRLRREKLAANLHPVLLLVEHNAQAQHTALKNKLK
jgi:hypothetical protein